MKNYGYATVSIKRKNFELANEYLSKVKKLHEPHMKAGLKVSLLVVYYELNWFESCISTIDSFKHLLDNDANIQEVIKEKFRKFIKAYNLLLELNNRNDMDLKLKLQKYLSETDGITSIEWLKRKAGEIGVEV